MELEVMPRERTISGSRSGRTSAEPPRALSGSRSGRTSAEPPRAVSGLRVDQTSTEPRTISGPRSGSRNSAISLTSSKMLDVARRRGSNRKQSVDMFAKVAISGQLQEKFAQQRKLLQMKKEQRKQTFLKVGGLKKIMAAPSIMMAFKTHFSPFVRFRRIARAVKLLIQVCHVCKSLLEDSVSQEAWFALVDNLAAAAALTSDKKKGRAFVTYVPNENSELEQLSFDLTEFMRHKKAEDYLTDDIRNIMKQRPGTRTEDQLVEVVRCMKNICKSFNEYPLTIQKQICQQAFFDQYRRNRVILRRGLAPDGIYFLLSGQLVEKPEGRKQPEEIDAGEKFGEEELICGSSRRATVLSKDEVEILYLHRFDYRLIFNMSTDTNDPKYLDICKTDAVFQHFPMQKLLDNPGTWSALKYKYGRLIVKDSNDIEWIYVIKSGEARVLKHLEPGRVDVKARRKKIQQQMEEQSSYHKQKKILDFIEDGNGRKSRYAPSNYHPPTVRRPTIQYDRMTPHKLSYGDHRIRSQSAVPAFARAQTSRPNTRRERPVTTCATTRRGEGSEDSDKENQDSTEEEEDQIHIPDINILVLPEESETEGETEEMKKTTFEDDGDLRPSTAGSINKASRFIETPHHRSTSGRCRGKNSSKDDIDSSMALPPFVQIETLHPGRTFGLRSCLEHDERGPSVSLVSGECEVLAINKKFFMKHCDDALISLIRLKAKPFPSQTELVDRLDANMQWEEFKQETLKDFLRHRIRVSR